MNLKNGKVFTSKFVGTGPSSYEKRIIRAAVSHRFRNTDLNHLGHETEREKYKQRNTIGKTWTVAVAERYGIPATVSTEMETLHRKSL